MGVGTVAQSRPSQSRDNDPNQERIEDHDDEDPRPPLPRQVGAAHRRRRWPPEGHLIHRPGTGCRVRPRGPRPGSGSDRRYPSVRSPVLRSRSRAGPTGRRIACGAPGDFSFQTLPSSRPGAWRQGARNSSPPPPCRVLRPGTRGWRRPYMGNVVPAGIPRPWTRTGHGDKRCETSPDPKTGGKDSNLPVNQCSPASIRRARLRLTP